MITRLITLALAASITSLATAYSDTQDTAIADQLFVAFDTETTGLSPKSERIVEIGAVRFKNGKVLEKRSWLVNPGKTIPHYATRVHGISNEMVQDAPAFAEVIGEFEAFIGNAVLVAHNAPFDVNMLSAEYQRAGKEFPHNEVIDSLKLARTWYPDLKSHKLGTMAEHLGLAKGSFHRALDDSLYLAQIFMTSTAAQQPTPTLNRLFELMGNRTEFKTIELKPISGS